jgi:hypothetical protein
VDKKISKDGEFSGLPWYFFLYFASISRQIACIWIPYCILGYKNLNSCDRCWLELISSYLWRNQTGLVWKKLVAEVYQISQGPEYSNWKTNINSFIFV